MAENGPDFITRVREETGLRLEIIDRETEAGLAAVGAEPLVDRQAETALVFDQEGNTIFWHLPPGRSGGSIPDTQSLWDVLWENRHRLGGVAHTHPWDGHPQPSDTDITTWHAIESALGKRLCWPIITMNEMTCFRWFPARNSDLYYQGVAWQHRYATHWLNNVLEMRRLSQGG
jgi:hypothetical protein